MNYYDFNYHRPNGFLHIIRMFRNIWHPECFHGHHGKKQFFEGWYYKLITSNGLQKWAIIPGVAFSNKGQDEHAFIQLMNGSTGKSYYERFELSDVHYRSDRFYIKIGKNSFSSEAMQLQISGSVQMEGTLCFQNIKPWSSSFFSPGIMGPYSFVPTMECNHGVLSMNHELTGVLKINGQPVDFSNGKGYMEKDWGTSFPKAWIWMQSNHFEKEQVSLCASTAIIPWRGSTFTGYIAGIMIENDLYTFTTYNGTKLAIQSYDDKIIKMALKNKKHTLQLVVHRAEGGILASPKLGAMEGRIKETMKSQIEVTLMCSKTGKILFKDLGNHAGLEVVGDVEKLIANVP